MRRIGILGGSFDPPHHGHIALAKAALMQFGLERVMLMTSASPPHKDGDAMTDAHIRHEMVTLAIEGQDGLCVFDYELNKSGKSYTAKTLTELLTLYPDWEIYFIIGGDSLRDFPSWYHPETVAEKCVLLVYPRSDVSDLAELIKVRRAEYNADIRLIDAPTFDVSSTEIRELIRTGGRADELLDERVLQFIKDKGLYV